MPLTNKILFVDDDANLLAAFQRNLRRQFRFDTAAGALEALELLKTGGPYALLVVDMRMPGMDGIEFFEQAKLLTPDSVRIMLTGNADQQTAVEAVNRGQVFRFLNKPCPPEVLVPTLEHGLKQYELLRTERELIEGTLAGSVKMLTEILGMVAPNALGRGQRLRESMQHFAQFIDAKPRWELEMAALLSAIGSASLPVRLLHKLAVADDLTVAEQAVVRRVPQIGHDLLASIPRLDGVGRIVLYQHKAFDGSGFPADNCRGEDIPLGARMLKILQDRLALEADGVVQLKALVTMRSRTGQYDPGLLDTCFVCFESFLHHTIAADRPVHPLQVRDLVAGHVVVSDITTREGLVLVAAGNRLTPMVLVRLNNHDQLGDVKEPVYVQDGREPTKESSVTGPDGAARS